MSVLTLNGIDLSGLCAGGSRLADAYRGERSRSPSGVLGGSRRTVVRRWEVWTVPLEPEMARAVRGLVQGEGYRWPFDTTLGAQADGGGPGVLYSVGDYAISDLGGGVAIVRVDNRVGWRVGQRPEWTLLGRAYFNLMRGHWSRFVLRSDGAQWDAGSRDDALDSSWVALDADTLQMVGRGAGAPTVARSTAYSIGDFVLGDGSSTEGWYECTTAGTTAASSPFATAYPNYGETVTDGSVVWTARGAERTRLYELTYLPWLLPEAWVADVNTRLTSGQWVSPPALEASGDWIGGTVTVGGSITDSELVAGTPNGGSFTTRLERLAFTLEEA